MASTIPVFGLEWHIRQSPSQWKLLNNPLSPYIHFHPIPWDGEAMPPLSPRQIRGGPLVFYFLPPPRALLENPRAKLVWIPMWDEARGYSREWWQALPKNLRIVSFSNAVRISAQSAGLPALSLKYFEDPEQIPEARWNEGRTMLYWNRAGLVGPGFLHRICAALRVDRLLFRRFSDPGTRASLCYALPPRLGKTVVQTVEAETVLSASDYHQLICQANIFLAPRSLEGVGLSFLEALAHGCAVFGTNAPTMNEYILHGTNGYLLPEYFPAFPSFLRRRIGRKARNVFPHGDADFTLSQWQNWDEIGRLDLEAMGAAAREDQRIGYESWRRSIREYAHFIMDW